MELDRRLLYSRGWGRHMRSWPRGLLGIENLKEYINISVPSFSISSRGSVHKNK